MSTMTVSAGFAGRPRPARRPAGTAAAPVGPAPTPARLTRRGRLLVTALTLLMLVAAAVVLTGGIPATAGTDHGRPVTAERVTVAPGETLWQIAERVAPGTDPRETVAQILELNGLQTSQVQVGTALLLP
jgi:Tfp pilus assembly protein FimV